jgi:antitoxin component of MazEF toxin-antitoxin module
MGFRTTIAKASTISNSFRTTVPAAIMNQFNLKDGDKLDWSLEVTDGSLMIIIHPEKKKRKKINDF